MATKYTARIIYTDGEGAIEGKKKVSFSAGNDADAFAKVLLKAYEISREDFVMDYMDYNSGEEDFIEAVKEFFNMAYEGDETLIDWIENTATHEKIFDSGADWDSEESEDW